MSDARYNEALLGAYTGANHEGTKSRIRRIDSPFDKSEEIWTVKRSALMTPIQIRWAYIKEFLRPQGRQNKAPSLKAFLRLMARFDESGGETGRGKTKEEAQFAVTPENIAKVEEYFSDNPRNSMCLASFDLQLSFTTIWNILRKELKWRAYRPNDGIEFLIRKFNQRIISRRSPSTGQT